MSQRNHGRVHSNARCNVGMQDTRRLRRETISHYYDSVPTQHYVLQGSAPVLVSALENISSIIPYFQPLTTPWDGKHDGTTTLLFDRARHFFGIFWLVFWSPRFSAPFVPRSSRPLVVWFSWCRGVLVSWSAGPLVHQSSVPLVLWSSDFFTFFFLVLFLLNSLLLRFLMQP